MKALLAKGVAAAAAKAAVVGKAAIGKIAIGKAAAGAGKIKIAAVSAPAIGYTAAKGIGVSEAVKATLPAVMKYGAVPLAAGIGVYGAGHLAGAGIKAATEKVAEPFSPVKEVIDPITGHKKMEINPIFIGIIALVVIVITIALVFR